MKHHLNRIIIGLIFILASCTPTNENSDPEIDLTLESLISKWNLMGEVRPNGEEVINQTSCTYYQFYANGTLDYKTCVSEVHTGTYILSGNTLQLFNYNQNNENIRGSIINFTGEGYKLQTIGNTMILRKGN